jgi:hypothetical protein
MLSTLPGFATPPSTSRLAHGRCRAATRGTLRRAFPAISGLTIAVLFVSACSGPESSGDQAPASTTRRAASDRQPAPESDATSGHTITSSRGTYVLTFTPEPEEIPLNDLFTLDVVVVDAERGAPVGEDTDLTVDAGMPAHRHGMNTRPVVERTGPGRFVVDGMLFHMSGEWELYFDVTRNGVTERAREVVVLE